MLKTILSLFGLALKSDVNEYRIACSKLGQRLQICSSDLLGIPDDLSVSYDVSEGNMQSMYIEVSEICDNFYLKFSPGASGYSWSVPEDLLQWLRD